MVEITEEPIDVLELMLRVRTDGDGALCIFVGTVRDFSEGRTVTGITYYAYREMAEKKMAEIEAEILARWPVTRVALVHRIGDLNVGDASVAVVVSAPHRAPAFEACRYAIDRIKERVPIWKKEYHPEGAHWVQGVQPVS